MIIPSYSLETIGIGLFNNHNVLTGECVRAAKTQFRKEKSRPIFQALVTCDMSSKRISDHLLIQQVDGRAP